MGLIQRAMAFFLASMLAACSTLPAPEARIEQSPGYAADKSKNLFVFLDGTANGPQSGTNVWRLKEAVTQSSEPALSAYIAGIGTAYTVVLGSAAGVGMETRILQGYEFLARNYMPGDRIFIIGFSRGAHQARSLAGLLAYSGLPERGVADQKGFIKIANRIIERTKQETDSSHADAWRSGRYAGRPPLAEALHETLGVRMRYVEIEFLGLWDTVPGSWFKDYETCREAKDSRPGERYKTGSYPNIKKIAHAVSLDEKRTKFIPILACPAIIPEHPVIQEVWFPGAHADVGGGYEDSNDLAGISLRWMAQVLAESFPLDEAKLQQFPGDPLGLSHWSMGDKPANIGSQCADRITPPQAVLHESVGQRRAAAALPVRIHAQRQLKPYPLLCNDMLAP